MIDQGDNVKLMQEQRPESVDLTVTEVPYGRMQIDAGFLWDYHKTLSGLYRITKKGGVVVWITMDKTEDGSETGDSFRHALCALQCGFKLHDTMIWDMRATTNAGSYRYRYFSTFKYMFVFSKGKAKTFNPLNDRKNADAGKVVNGKKINPYGMRFNVWHYPPKLPDRQIKHPAPMPLQLAKDHIQSWSNEGDVVLDPFAGSGTVCMAAKELGRKYLGYEIEQQYVEMANKRIMFSNE